MTSSKIKNEQELGNNIDRIKQKAEQNCKDTRKINSKKRPLSQVDTKSMQKLASIFGAKVKDVEPKKVAQQICLMGLELFKAVQPRECVHQQWK
eukprot:UN33863